jgi:hypothetical protein
MEIATTETTEKCVAEDSDATKIYIFNFETDEADLRDFIAENFVAGKSATSKIQITQK